MSGFAVLTEEKVYCKYSFMIAMTIIQHEFIESPFNNTIIVFKRIIKKVYFLVLDFGTLNAQWYTILKLKY